MKLVQIAILWVIIGTAGFLLYAHFRPNFATWVDDLYFIWDSGKDCLLIGAIIALVNKEYRPIVRPLLIYSLINFLWQIVVPITSIDANHPVAVTILFSALLTIVIILFIKDLIQLQKRK